MFGLGGYLALTIINLTGSWLLALPVSALAVAREELRNSDARFRHLFDSVTDGITVMDPEDGTIVEANQAFRELFGYGRDERVQSMAQISLDPARSLRILHRMSADGALHIPRRVGRRKDGSPVAAASM